MSKPEILIACHSGAGGTSLLVRKLRSMLSTFAAADFVAVSENIPKPLSEYNLLVLAFPVYALQASASMREFVSLLNVPETGIDAFVMCTKSLVSGDAVRKFSSLLAEKRIRLCGAVEFRAPGTDISLIFPTWQMKLMYSLFRMAFGFERAVFRKLDKTVSGIRRVIENAGLSEYRPRRKLSMLFWGPLQKLVFDPSPLHTAPLLILEDRCTQCNECIQYCPRTAWRIMDKDVPVWNKTECDRCMRCVHWCPENAIIFDRQMKDRPRLTREFYSGLLEE